MPSPRTSARSRTWPTWTSSGSTWGCCCRRRDLRLVRPHRRGLPEHAGRAYNNYLADYCRADASRLKGIALLPRQSVGGGPRSRSCGAPWGKLGFVAGFLRSRTPSYTATCTTGRTTRSMRRRWSWVCRSWSAARRAACCRNSGGPLRRRPLLARGGVHHLRAVGRDDVAVQPQRAGALPRPQRRLSGRRRQLAALLDRAAGGALGRDPLRPRLPEHAAAGLRLPEQGFAAMEPWETGPRRCVARGWRPGCRVGQPVPVRCPRFRGSSTRSSRTRRCRMSRSAKVLWDNAAGLFNIS